MRDSIDDDDIDRAYRTAVDTTTDVAAVRRRRGVVLEAVGGLDAAHDPAADRQRVVPGARTAANEAHRHPSATWWRGVAAACVIGTSALVVMRMQEAPEATVETALRSDADRVAAPAPAGESTAVRVAEAVPRQPGLATAPASPPAPGMVTDTPRRVPIGPATAPAGVPTITAADPVARAARSAFPDDGTAVLTGRVGPSGAAASAMDAAPREPAVAALPSTPILTPDPPERQERSTSRTEQPSATPKEALGAAAVLPPSRAAAQAGNAAAKTLPPRDDAVRAGQAAVRGASEGLLVAVNKGDIEATRTLLQTTDPDAERDADGRTALAIAVLRADVPLVKLLLASGANRRAVDRFGHTPVSYANASGDTMMLQSFERP